jgi:hypothetical protein
MARRNQLPIIGQSVNADYYHLPKNHQPVIVVPLVKGARCTSCKWVSTDLKHCLQKDYQRFMGTSRLPGPAWRICSDWWEAP